MALKVFHNDLEQGYHPRHSFFYGRFTPYPYIPLRTRSILAAIKGRSGFEVTANPPLIHQDAAIVQGMDYLEALGEVFRRLAEDEKFFPFHMRALPLLKASPYPRLRVGYFALDGRSGRRRIVQIGRPLLIVQEGGYDVASLGKCVSRFFEGLGIGSVGGVVEEKAG